MPQKSIINITNNELALIVDPNYPLTKQNAILKIKALLSQTAQLILDNEQLKMLVQQKNYKISLGENYLSLPYVVVDIPKLTTDNPHFNARLMFWWGKYFIFQYFINSKQYNCHKLFTNLPKLDGYFVLLNNQIWNNNIEDFGYKECINLKDEDYYQLQTLNTIKIVGIHPIESYGELDEAAINFYTTLKHNL